MAWYNPLSWSAFTGVDLDAEAKRRAELEAWETALDEKAAERGIWDEQAQEVHRRQQAIDAAAYGSGSDYAGQVNDAFVEGAQEGLADMQTGVKDTLTGGLAFSVKGVLGFVPWWAWLAGAIYLAWRGGFLAKLIRK